MFLSSQGGHYYFRSNPSTNKYIYQYIFSLAVYWTHRIPVHPSTKMIFINVESSHPTGRLPPPPYPKESSAAGGSGGAVSPLAGSGTEPRKILKFTLNLRQSEAIWTSRNPVHQAVHPQKSSYYQYIWQYVFDPSTNKYNQYISTRVATLAPFKTCSK